MTKASGDKPAKAAVTRRAKRRQDLRRAEARTREYLSRLRHP